MGARKQARKSKLPAELRRRAFVDAYCGQARFNGCTAARLVGYFGTAKALTSRAAELLARPDVQEMLRERLVAAEVDKIADAREAMVVLSSHLRGTMDDFTSFDEDGNVVIDIAKAKKDKKLGLVKKIRFKKRDEKDVEGVVIATTYETHLELYDAQSAAEKILKARGVIGHDPIPLASPETMNVEERALQYIEKWLATGNSPDALPPAMREMYRSKMVKSIDVEVRDDEAASGA